MARPTQNAHEENAMQTRRFVPVRTALALSATAVALAACGGGGGGSPAAAPAPAAATEGAVPVTASASVPGLIAWASTDPRSETAEPLSTDAFHPPTDDTAEPTTVQ
jgi:hypothetical protein